ncbi:MAG: sulfite exporter TauE/SafE family protein [Bacteroidota bacterium]
MLWSALGMGLLGSFHCVGMCGPIVLAVPGKSLLSKLSYNFGRTITYMIMGAIIGFVGEGFSLIGYQQPLSVAVGVAMLLIVLFTRYKHFDMPMTGVVTKMWIYSKNKLSPLFKSQSPTAPFFIGLINGLLPCGLVYAALFAAISMGGIVESALYMGLFGIGTAPLLIVLSVFGTIISPAWRNKLNRAVPYFLGLVAILLILRGLNLGIPLVSPKMDKDGKMKHMEHSSLYEPQKDTCTLEFKS